MSSPQYAYTMLRAHQYLYYIKARPIISDEEFDRMEDRWESDGGEPLPVGSEFESDYTDDERLMARVLAMDTMDL
jgi:hypothetical protein